jgi:hypothetical protein
VVTRLAGLTPMSRVVDAGGESIAASAGNATPPAGTSAATRRAMWRRTFVLVASLLATFRSGPASADQCRIVDLQLTPASSKLQIVGWIEDAVGNYVDTIYITQQVGLYGLGNRPGRFDLNSGPRWPYGRRLTVFPVWSHRHGKTFSQVFFQGLQDNDISQPFSTSSQEKHYCRPMTDMEPGWDTGTCASTIFTDKGAFSTASQQQCGTCSGTSTICYKDGDCSGGTCAFNMAADGGTCTTHGDCCSGYCDAGTCSGMTRYPPRTDLSRQAGPDSPSVSMYATLAPWDAVSAATPAAGAAQDILWVVPGSFPPGNYVAWVEVGLEFDPNGTYNSTSYPSPNVPFNAYGEAYRGQPSVLYQVPFTVGATESIATTASYVGYGDPNGVDGAVRPPDATITTDTPGSGGSRLQLVSESGATYRVRIDAHPPITTTVPPDAPTQLTAETITNQTVTVSFVAPGASSTPVRGYDVRIRADGPITDANFDSSTPIAATVRPGAAGAQVTFDVTNLLPSTDYYIGIRAYDVCKNNSPVAMLTVRTTDPKVGEVSACFVATAAYGTAMANEVEMLRHFRDSMLRSTVIGELAVETYYTFGPPVAGVVGESDLLRQAARDLLAPLVRVVRGMAW